MMIFDPKSAEYMCQLEDSFDCLKDALQQMRNKKGRINMTVQREETPYNKRTYKVIDWLYRAEHLEVEAEKLIADCKEELEKRWPGCCCLMNCCSSSKVGLRVCEILKAVNLLVRVNFDAVVERTPNDLVDVIHLENNVAFESNLDDIWRCLRDGSIGIVGIYGMAGIGKTTLMKKIRDELVEKGLHFPVVIWFRVSKPASINALQDVIRNEFAIPDKIWKRKNKEDRAKEISRLLGNRKFILFLDGLQEKFDLLEAGVPSPNENGSKVVFATRSEQVCDDVKVQIKLKLKCFSPEESLKFFWANVGEDYGNYHHQVEHLAGTINAEVCQGLPLALILTGKAMGRLRNPKEWEHAVRTIENNPTTLPGMNGLFHILDASCDSLDDDVILRDCFLYCSILPGVIKKDELINLWIGEGFLDSSDRNLGEYIIKRLQLSCLLESDETSDSVRMHGISRAFGLWLASERGRKKNKILTQERSSEKWSKAMRISIYDQVDLVPPQNPCPRVKTLLLKNVNLVSPFPTGFFQSMKDLGVLNLSGNKSLTEILLGALINLHYLNLSYTSIRELPTEVNSFKKLKVLLLDYTENFQIIPNGVVSNISSLQVFSKLGNEIFDDATLLEELECIEDVGDISVSLFKNQAVERMLNSGKLQKCIRKLFLKKIKMLKVPISTLSRMVHLEELIIEECEDLQIETDNTHYYVLNFHCLQIRHCSSIINLQKLMFAPKLETLCLSDCESLLQIIGNEFNTAEIKEINERLGIFSNLKQLYLQNLPLLECICPQMLHFPVLKDILVSNCPRLLKLPFTLHCTNRLRQIKGCRTWLDRLHWEDQAAGVVFHSRFQDCNTEVQAAGGPQQCYNSISSSSHAIIDEQQVQESLNIQAFTKVGQETGPSQSGMAAKTVHSMVKRKLGRGRRSSNGMQQSLQITCPKPFTYEKLVKATKGFSHKVGRDGFFSVYKGILTNGEVIAVKKFDQPFESNWELCHTEVKITSRIHHRHIVKLLGYCINKSNQLLVYKFVPNRSLRHHLHELSERTIKWSDRMKIALGSAKGLAYLNEGCSPRIIHRDIKPSKILLDSEFEPKITGFEIAVDFPDDDTHIDSDIAGTYGYMEPESPYEGVTEKADVYSFGVVLLELITGKRKDFQTPHFLVKHQVQQALAFGDYGALIDPKLQGQYDRNEMTRMIHCAAACVYKPAQSRPKMSQIVEAVKGNAMPLERIWIKSDIKFLFDAAGSESASEYKIVERREITHWESSDEE